MTSILKSSSLQLTSLELDLVVMMKASASTAVNNNSCFRGLFHNWKSEKHVQ